MGEHRPRRGSEVGSGRLTRGKHSDRQPAPGLPVARVCVDVSLAHLDRPFDYLVPAELAEQAQPGTRVRVRFAGQLVDGWLLERVAASTHTGSMRYLERVVSAEPVLTEEIARLCRVVADRYAGNLADVLRLAVPPRHARTERAISAQRPTDDRSVEQQSGQPATGQSPTEVTPTGQPRTGSVPVGQPHPAWPDSTGWRSYPRGPGFLRALTAGRAARAVWSALPGEEWPARFAEAAAATVRGGRGVVAVVADARDLARLDAAMTAELGTGQHVILSAALGPARRYRAFLQACRGQVPVVIGTRAAMFAPVRQLGLVAIWDDGDDLYTEPRAPYPHAREVLLIRAYLGGAGVLLGGYARTAEAQLLVETGWAKEILPTRALVRARAPWVTPTGDEPQLARDPAAATARLPSLAWEAARSALRADAPVLVQVPRRGYLPAVACAACRAAARCRHCAGPLALPAAGATPSCRWCARVATGYRCAHCGGRRLRAAVTGARRTAEELGRAFPGVPVRTSGREEVLRSVPAGPQLVISTPGAEPPAVGGYGAVLLLDTWALLTRADLRAGEEALRRWLAAAVLARPAEAGGRVVVVADGGLTVVQALLRWDPVWFAERELAQRRELGFPPAQRMVSLTGHPEAIAELVAELRLPTSAQVLGPVPADGDQERMLIRVPRGQAAAVADAVRAAMAVRTARKAGQPVRVQVDPLGLL